MNKTKGKINIIYSNKNYLHIYNKNYLEISTIVKNKLKVKSCMFSRNSMYPLPHYF